LKQPGTAAIPDIRRVVGVLLIFPGPEVVEGRERRPAPPGGRVARVGDARIERDPSEPTLISPFGTRNTPAATPIVSLDWMSTAQFVPHMEEEFTSTSSRDAGTGAASAQVSVDTTPMWLSCPTKKPVPVVAPILRSMLPDTRRSRPAE
jgi:hypothetical protein